MLFYNIGNMKKITKYDIANNSITKLSKKIAINFLEDSGVIARESQKRAVIMAGIPGSGKTEFLGSFFRMFKDVRDNFVRIDLDEVVKVFEDYTPETDFLFREKGVAIINSIFNAAIKKGYNIALDGTFGGNQAILNINRLIKRGYTIQLYIMNESVEQAKKYTKVREEKQKRKITDEAFYGSIDKIKNNLQKLPDNKNLQVFVIEKNIEKRQWHIESLKRYGIDNLYLK